MKYRGIGIYKKLARKKMLVKALSKMEWKNDIGERIAAYDWWRTAMTERKDLPIPYSTKQ